MVVLHRQPHAIRKAATEYGYQLTFFRTALTPDMPARASDLASNQVYMAHFALTDGGRQEHESFERFSRGAAGLAGAQGEPLFKAWLEDWSATEVEPGVVRLQAATDGQQGPVAIDLTLRETRPPVLQGDRGLHQKGPEPGNASYYYSLTGLESSGVITSAGRTIPVTRRKLDGPRVWHQRARPPLPRAGTGSASNWTTARC